MITVRSSGRPKYAGGIGGDVGRRDEQALAPGRHRRFVALDQLELRQEVRRVVDGDRAFGSARVEQAQRGGTLGVSI